MNDSERHERDKNAEKNTSTNLPTPTTKAIILLQSVWRSRLAKKKCFQIAQSVIEKIYDPRSKQFYYYNAHLNRSRWTIPLFLEVAKGDIKKVAPTYTDIQAAVLIQSMVRLFFARRKYELLYKTHKQNSKSDDNDTTTTEDDESSENGYNESDSDDDTDDDDSQSVRARRYPRSRMQKLVDDAEDAPQDDPIMCLDLSSLGASRVSSRIYDLGKSLKTLNLSGNKLTRISPDLSELVNLTTLNISRNRLVKVPREMDELENLRRLDMSFNSLRSYPSSLYKLKLEEWDMSHNFLKKIHVEVGNLDLLKDTKEWEVGIGLMKSLRVFKASHNKLNTFPEQIERCIKLKELHLCNNIIGTITENVGSLSKLQIVDFTRNKIKLLPNSCTKWISLHTFKMAKNNLQALPSRMTGWKNSLNRIYLDHNKLEELPDSIEDLTKVTELICSHNSIRKVSPNIGMMSELRIFNAKRNYLDDFPNSLLKCRKLQTINLSNNRFTSVPTGLRQLFKLVTLSMRRNNLSQVNGIGTLMSAKIIDLAYNDIEKFPSDLIKLSKLERLDLSHNKIQNLPDEIEKLGKLKLLNVSFNRIIRLPSSMSRLASLHCLYLGSNKLDSIPTELKQLTNMKKISLCHNLFQERPSVLDGYIYALHFDMDGNPIHREPSIDENINYLAGKAISCLSTQSCHEVNDQTDFMLGVNATETVAGQYEHYALHTNKLVHLPFDFRHHFNLAIAQMKMARSYFGNAFISTPHELEEEGKEQCDDSAPKEDQESSIKDNDKNNDQSYQDKDAFSILSKSEIENDDFRPNCIPHQAKIWLEKALKSLDKTEELFAAGKGVHGKGAQIYFNQGVCLFLLGYYDQAITVLSKTIEIRPRHVASMMLRAKIRLRLGLIPQALQESIKLSNNASHLLSKYTSTTVADISRLRETCEQDMELLRSHGLCPRELEQTFDISDGNLKRNRRELRRMIWKGRSERKRRIENLRTEKERCRFKREREREQRDKLVQHAHARVQVVQRQLIETKSFRDMAVAERVEAEKIMKEAEERVLDDRRDGVVVNQKNS